MKKQAFDLSHTAQLHYLHVRRQERCNLEVETKLSCAEIITAKIRASPHESQIYGKIRFSLLNLRAQRASKDPRMHQHPRQRASPFGPDVHLRGKVVTADSSWDHPLVR